MVTEAETTANSIIAEALKAAGVPPRNIELPAETPTGELIDGKLGIPNPDGTPKGQTKGADAEPEEKVIPESKAQESAEAEFADETKPLAKAEITALIDQASSKFQSIMDRRIYQLNAQMQQTINALNQFFQSQETAGIANLPENEQVLKRLEKLEKGGQLAKIQIQQPIEAQPAQFYQQLANFVDAVGLKIDDKRIDWVLDVTDPQVGFNRFLGSIKKALTEDQTKVIQELKKDGEKEIQKVRKKTGVDKVSTSGAGGAGLPNIDKMTPFQKIEYAFQQNELAGKQ